MTDDLYEKARRLQNQIFSLEYILKNDTFISVARYDYRSLDGIVSRDDVEAAANEANERFKECVRAKIADLRAEFERL